MNEKEKLLDSLKTEIKKYLSSDQIEDVLKAYEYADNFHKGQLRKSGEEYIFHPINVALILTTVLADKETLISALLHDVLEDTDATKLEIENIFGEKVANLVDGVTKINNIKVSTKNEYLTNYYKKIIVGISEDVRVIIIKLADRLHNMRTLYALPVEKQKKKAKETLEILTPIAHRLGMHKIKSELEDLSLKYLKPDVYFDIVERLNNTKLERESYVLKMMDEVSTLLKHNNIKHEIKGRAKSIYSIYNKLDKGKSWKDIYDLLAIRIIVEEESLCYLALGLIHSKYKPLSKRFKDYIAMPKTNLYQSLHTTVFGPLGYLYEIQIRTYSMDEIAEKGIASHWAYKEKKNAALEMQNITEQKLQFYKSIIELNEEQLSSEDFVKGMKQDVLNKSVYIYTVKGDVIELPYGSTPIDFAYKIHTEVGHKMTGALVNNVMVPLTYVLKSTDIVKIITNQNSKGPSRSWLKIAKTNSAKEKIKSFFNKLSREEYIQNGKLQLEKELRRKKISITEFMKPENLKPILEGLNFTVLDDLYLNIGNNKLSSKIIIKEAIKPEDIDILEDKQILKNEKTLDNDVIIGGITNISAKTANCCNPLPGDEIIGYITKSNGITIHRKKCCNINLENQKIIDALWNNETNKKYDTEIVIYTNSEENIVLEIVKSIIPNVYIDSINTINKDDTLTYLLKLKVNNLETLNTYIKEILKIKYVSDAIRITK